MTKHLRKLGEYNSSLLGALAAASAVLAAILGLGGFLPEKVAGWATAATAGIATVSATLIRYKDAIDKFGDDAADLLDR